MESNNLLPGMKTEEAGPSNKFMAKEIMRFKEATIPVDIKLPPSMIHLRSQDMYVEGCTQLDVLVVHGSANDNNWSKIQRMLIYQKDYLVEVPGYDYKFKIYYVDDLGNNKYSLRDLPWGQMIIDPTEHIQKLYEIDSSYEGTFLPLLRILKMWNQGRHGESGEIAGPLMDDYFFEMLCYDLKPNLQYTYYDLGRLFHIAFHMCLNIRENKIWNILLLAGYEINLNVIRQELWRLMQKLSATRLCENNGEGGEGRWNLHQTFKYINRPKSS